MEWHAHWEDPLTAYLTHFDDVIGDARTPFTATVKGIIAAGSLVCQRIAAASLVLAAVQQGAQRAIQLVMRERTKRAPDLDAEHLTAKLRSQAVAHRTTVPTDEV